MIVDVCITLYTESKCLQSSFWTRFAFLFPSLSRNQVIAHVFFFLFVFEPRKLYDLPVFMNVNRDGCDRVLFFTECLNLEIRSSSLVLHSVMKPGGSWRPRAPSRFVYSACLKDFHSFVIKTWREAEEGDGKAGNKYTVTYTKAFEGLSPPRGQSTTTGFERSDLPPSCQSVGFTSCQL